MQWLLIAAIAAGIGFGTSIAFKSNKAPLAHHRHVYTCESDSECQRECEQYEPETDCSDQYTPDPT